MVTFAGLSCAKGHWKGMNLAEQFEDIARAHSPKVS